MAVKLSDTQRDVISKMRAGKTLHFQKGIDACCWFADGTFRSLRWDTIHKLTEFGLIELGHDKVLLTEKGKTEKLLIKG